MKAGLVMAITMAVALCAPTTSSMYNCFKTRNCFLQFNMCDVNSLNPLNKEQAEEMNKCLSAVSTRNLCLVRNNCSFTET